MTIIGHQKQWQYLEKLLSEDRLPHAFLFSGQEKLGKKTLAIEFLSKFFGKKPLNHPDFIFLEPTEGIIQISQIKELIWKISLKPYSAKIKVAVIDQAHLMNKDAQNCFLKTLEEPNQNTFLILITPFQEILLPTIVSRCQILKFFPVPNQEIENYLKKERMTKEEIKTILTISQGRPGVAIELSKNEGKIKERAEIINQFQKLIRSDLVFRFQYAKTISDQPNLKEIIDYWLFYLRDCLLSKLSENNPLIKKDIERIKKIEEMNFLISTTNVNYRLALENLFLNL